MITLIIIIAIIALPLIAALFVKKDYTVERSIVIDQPKEAVFSYIKYLKNQDNYSKWILMDPNVKKGYSGIDGTPGFIATWESNDKKVGQGEQELKKIADGEKIESEIRFIKPFSGKADAYMSTDSLNAGQTQVKWGFDSAMKYPMNLMLLFMDMEKMVGHDLAIGLANLKVVLEDSKHCTETTNTL
jgi:hypothetical protein